MDKIYLSPAQDGTGEITEKRSRFIGNISRVSSESEALDFIKHIKKKYYDAKHSAYAYITDGIKRYSDDGEPAKTAGLPILDMLDNMQITDCVCVVTRYFGGILLGTGGLVRSYTAAAKAALDNAGIKKMTLHDKYLMKVPYSVFDSLKYISSEFGCEFTDCEFTDKIQLTAICEIDKSSNLLNKITSAFGANIEIEHIECIYR